MILTSQEVFDIMAMASVVTLMWSFFGALVYITTRRSQNTILMLLQVAACGPVIWVLTAYFSIVTYIGVKKKRGE